MTTPWTPRPPLQGAALFLSASVPHPKRDARFLQGPLEDWLMLRVIDQRVFDAVQCLVAQLLERRGDFQEAAMVYRDLLANPGQVSSKP